MIRHLYSAAAGSAVTCGAVVWTGGTTAGAFWLGCGLTLTVLAVVARLIGRARLARWIGGAVIRTAPARRLSYTKSLDKPAPPVIELSTVESEVVSALVNFNADPKRAHAAVVSLRSRGALDFSTLFRAASPLAR